MIRINIVGLLFWAIFIAAVVFGWPVWIALAWLALEHTAVRWIIVGFIGGMFVPLSIGFNMGLRLRREQARERADQDYDRDKRSLFKR